MTVKLIETDSEFLEVAGHKIEAEGSQSPQSLFKIFKLKNQTP